jgi:hypothetical protein
MTDEAAAESAEYLDDVQLDAVDFVRASPRGADASGLECKPCAASACCS